LLLEGWGCDVMWWCYRSERGGFVPSWPLGRLGTFGSFYATVYITVDFEWPFGASVRL
jgi:hypothetical protein